jgi:hypothetical protein
MMQRLTIAITILAVPLAGCAGLRPGWETPTVTVKSVWAIPSQGMLPELEIYLHIVNPSREALKLAGMSYTVSLQGHDLIKGVGSDLPVIEGYGEGDITLTASADLFAGVDLVRELTSGGEDTLGYSFEAKLDPGALRPSIRVRDSGDLVISGARNAP